MATKVALPTVRFGNAAQDRWAQQLNVLLQNINTATSTTAAQVTVINQTVASGGTGGGVVDTPTIPTEFTATGAYSTILLKWAFPTYAGHSITEVWRSETDNFSAAIKIVETAITLWSDSAGVGKGYYYWIRHRNSNGDIGALNATAGTYAETAQDLDALFQQVTGKITALYLDAGLTSTVDLVATLDTRSSLTLDSLNLHKDDTLLGYSGTFDGLITQVNANADLFDEAGVYVGYVRAIENVVLDPVTGLEKVRADLIQEQSTRVTDEAAITQLINTLSAQVNHADTGLPAVTADLTENYYTKASADTAISQKITAYEIDVNGTPATLATVAGVAYSAESGYQAQWGVQTDVAGIQGGVGFYNNGLTTLFALKTDAVAIIDTVTDEVTELFTVVNNDPVIPDGVYMNAAFIKVATIRDLVVGEINADSVNANAQITSPFIDGGVITGGQIIVEAGASYLDINPAAVLPFWFGPASLDKTSVNANLALDSTGKVYTKGLEIRALDGDIMLDTNGYNGTYIKNLSVDTLAIKDNAVSVPIAVNTAEISTKVGNDIIVMDESYLYESSSDIMFSFALSMQRLGDATSNYDSVTVNAYIYQDATLVKTIIHNDIYADAGGSQSPRFLVALAGSASLTGQGNYRLKVTATPNNAAQDFSCKLDGFITNAKK